MKKLSIIIPTYNLEKYIEQCLVPLFSQLNKDIEIIIIDDCSFDKTTKIIDGIIQKYCRPVHFIKLPQNHGVSFARNMGLSLASGEYIAFIDGDDIISSEYIKTILQYISSGCDYYKLSWQTMVGNVITYRASNLPPWNCSVWSRVFRADIIRKEFDVTLKWSEDAQFIDDNLKVGMTYECIEDVLYFYRNHREGSLSIQHSLSEAQQ